MARLQAALAAAGAAWGIVAVVSMTYGAQVVMPDNVNTNYGFPRVFAFHTTSTIAGPADIWHVDLTSLAEHLVFWVDGILVLMTAAIIRPGRTSARLQGS